jgi:hypothetical protein
MNQFRLWYIYTWKCHNEIPCMAILDKQKCHFLKQNQRIGRQNRSCLGDGRGENTWKGCGKLNIVEILCAHVCKWKNVTCWNYSKNVGEEEKRRMMEGVNSVEWYIVRNFVTIMIYSKYNNNKNNLLKNRKEKMITLISCISLTFSFLFHYNEILGFQYERHVYCSCMCMCQAYSIYIYTHTHIYMYVLAHIILE